MLRMPEMRQSRRRGRDTRRHPPQDFGQVRAAIERRRIGNLLRFVLDKQGLSQSAAAELLGVTRQAVSTWTSGTSYPLRKHFPGLCGLALGLDLSKSDAPYLHVLADLAAVGVTEKRMGLRKTLRRNPRRWQWARMFEVCVWIAAGYTDKLARIEYLDWNRREPRYANGARPQAHTVRLRKRTMSPNPFDLGGRETAHEPERGKVVDDRTATTLNRWFESDRQRKARISI